jgi:1-acyl-sn-glycerol-3-phosphate acyltransferase
LTRTGSRAARVGVFALETWTRISVATDAPLRARARELSWVAENVCALHGVRPLVRGAVPSEPCVLVANHLSYFDPLVIAALVPLTAVAKHEVASWPVVGELGRKLGVLYVERDNPASGARVLRQGITALAQGVSVLVFPEGTTSMGESVLPFKRGIFGAAMLAGVPIVPVALGYDRPDAAWVGDQTFFPHYVRSIARPCTRVRVDFLPPLSHARTAAELAHEAREAIARALAADHPLRGAEPTFDGWLATA